LIKRGVMDAPGAALFDRKNRTIHLSKPDLTSTYRLERVRDGRRTREIKLIRVDAETDTITIDPGEEKTHQAFERARGPGKWIPYTTGACMRTPKELGDGAEYMVIKD
jgi:hypothetical protein